MREIRMKPGLRRWAAGVALCLAGAAAADDAERYRFFLEEGVLDAAVSNETANALVREGIASDSAEIVDLTVRALGELASPRLPGPPSPHGPRPERTFAEVAGLKAFLIGRFRARHQGPGRNLQRIERESVEGVATVPGDDLESYRKELRRRAPAWTLIPQVLCAFWPQDDDVHELIWAIHDTDGSPPVDQRMRTLGLLNAGGFATQRANEFRLRHLQEAAWPADFPTVVMAVQGLALARPAAALAPLIEAAREYPAIRGGILVAIAGYDDEQLAAHAAALREIVADGPGGPVPSAASEQAFERLKDISQRAP